MKIFKHIKFPRFDSKTEVEFIQDYNEKSIPILRFSLIFMFTASLLFSYLDFYAVPISKELIWLIRGIFVELVIIILFAISYTKMIKRYYQTIVSLSSIFMGIGSLLTVAVSRPSELGNYSYYAGAILIFICIISLRLRFNASVIVISTIIISYISMVIMIYDILIKEYKDLMEPVFINNIFFLVGAGMAVVVAIYLLESLARLNFLQKKKIISDMHLKTELDEIKRIESALRESEYKYRSLFESSRDALMTLHPPEWKFTSGNHATVKMFNTKDEKEFISLGPWELSPEFQPDGMPSGDKAKIMIEKAMAEGSNFFEWTHKRYNGEPFPATVLLTKINISGDEYLQATVRDISVRKQSESLLNTFFNLIPDLVCIASTEGYFKKLNASWEKLLGYDIKELLAQPMLYFMHPDDVELTKQEVEKQINGLSTDNFVNRYRTKNGDYKWLEWKATPSPDGQILYATARDITARKQAERDQKLSAGILGILNQDILMKDTINSILREIKKETGFDALGIRLAKDGDYPYYVQDGFSKGFLKTENTLFEYTESGDVCRDSNGNVSLECTCGLVISGKADLNLPFFTKNGSFWTNYSEPLLDLTAEEDPRNNPRNRCIHGGFMSVAIIPIRIGNEIVGTLQLNDKKRDCFTEDSIHFFEELSNIIGVALMRKQGEDVLKESEEKYRALFERDTNAIFIYDSETTDIIDANEATSKIYEYSKDELIGMSCLKLSAEAKESASAIGKIKKDGVFKVPVRYHQKSDGTVFPVELNAYQIEVNGRILMFAITKDISERLKMEKALIQSEDFLNCTGDMAKVGGWQLDLKTMKVIWTRSTSRICELPDDYVPDLEEAINFYHPDDRQIVSESVKRAIEAGESYDIEVRLITAKDHQLWVRSQGQPVFESGKCVQLSGTFQDITERKQVEEAIKESEEKFRTISEGSPDAIFITNQKGDYLYVNQSSSDLLGYSTEELTSMNITDISLKSEIENNINIFQRVLKGDIVFVEINLVKNDGDIIPVDINAMLLPNGLIYGSCRDISERKKTEEELINITSTKDKFYSIIAHDLRGPMGSLMKISALLADDFDSFDIEDRNLILKEIKESTKNSFSLLENLLTWSRSQKSEIEFNPEEINLHNAVEHVLKTQRLVAATKKILITSNIPEDIVITADENMLKTILRNFIGNSIKFTPEEGNVIVSQKAIDGFIQVSITDNGIGMDEETRNKLFKIDENQSSDGTAGEKGTGLGLILCKEFTEKHGGKVFVESEEGKGSIFTFTLPKRD